MKLVTLFLAIALSAMTCNTATATDFKASIDAEILTLELAMPAQELEAPDKGSRLWRAFGFANYLAAGNVATSQFYREDRASSTWEPTIDNVTARLATQAGTVEAINMSSEWLRRRGSTTQAWMARVGYFAAAIYVSTDNYHNGWKRR